MWIRAEDILALGVPARTVRRNVASGAWRSRETGRHTRNGRAERELWLASLPDELQIRWAARAHAPEPPDADTPADAPQPPDTDARLQEVLTRWPASERAQWLAEAQRLAAIVEQFLVTKPRQQRNPTTGRNEYVAAVLALCADAICSNATLLAAEPHRANAPAPRTLERWAQQYATDGLLTFLRGPQQTKATDTRKAAISPDAVQWINSHWRNYRSVRHLYRALTKRAKAESWLIPSQGWLYRLWDNLPEIVKTYHLEGEKAYTSRHLPYVPRDFSGLGALQILCGDHSQRDVSVRLADGTLTRPWLTMWQCLRTGLIWGWHLDLTPSSQTAALAYAQGVREFGAQPPAQPDANYYPALMTDQGKDYRSKNIDGQIIAVHEHAMRPDGGFEMLLKQRYVGWLQDLDLQHILARPYNAKEKPIERTHKDISDWEENTFTEWCGRDAKNKPDAWVALWHKHHKLLKRGQADKSDVMTLDAYREELRGWIASYNAESHTRATLGGANVVPIELYQQLYPTRYDIRPETLALLLMKHTARTIGKNGIQLFQQNWFYFHPAMSAHKKGKVEVRYTDDDRSRVWVVLPDGQMCEAQLITPLSGLTANKATLDRIREARKYERKLMTEAELVQQSVWRGETLEDRLAAQLKQIEAEGEAESQAIPLPIAAACVQKTSHVGFCPN